jgi:hypothetical protein
MFLQNVSLTANRLHNIILYKTKFFRLQITAVNVSHHDSSELLMPVSLIQLY